MLRCSVRPIVGIILIGWIPEPSIALPMKTKVVVETHRCSDANGISSRKLEDGLTQLSSVGFVLVGRSPVGRIVEVRATCALDVRDVYSDGIVLSSGEALQLLDDSAKDAGPVATDADMQSDCGQGLRPGLKIVACKSISGVINSAGPTVSIERNGSADVITLSDKTGSHIRLVTARPGTLRGLGYLPSPDSKGGLIVTYLAVNVHRGYMISVNSPL